MEPTTLFVEVPFCSFRPHTSRDYQDTFHFPPPSTVFGMLLSLSGVDWPRKLDHVGVKIALALEGEPEPSRVLRKLRRVPQNSPKADPLADRRPDFQEILVDLRLWIWLSHGEERPPYESLVSLVAKALSSSHRHTLNRYGGLALGESTNLVNDIVLNPEKQPSGDLAFLVATPEGYYRLPIWVDHPRSGREGSAYARFTVEQRSFETPSLSDPCWITIAPSDA